MPSSTHERSTSKQLRSVVPAANQPSNPSQMSAPLLGGSAPEVEARLLALLRQKYSTSDHDLGTRFVMPSVEKLPATIADQVETSTLQTYFDHFKTEGEAPLGFVKFVAEKLGFASDVVLAYVSTFGVDDEEQSVPFNTEAKTLKDYESHLLIEVANTAKNRKQAAQQGFSNSCGKALACMSNETARTQAIFSHPESVDRLDADWESEIEALEGNSLKKVMSFFKSAFKACLQSQATMSMSSTTQQQWKDYEDLKAIFFGGDANQKETLLTRLREPPNNMVRQLVPTNFQEEYRADLPGTINRSQLQNQLTLRERAYQQAFCSAAQHDKMVSPLAYPSVGMAAAACSQAIPVPALGGLFSALQTASPMLPFNSQLPTPVLPFGAASVENPFNAFSPIPPAPVPALVMDEEQKKKFMREDSTRKRKPEGAQPPNSKAPAQRKEASSAERLEKLNEFAQTCASLAEKVNLEIDTAQAKPDPVSQLLPTSELKESILEKMRQVKSEYDELTGKTSGASSSSEVGAEDRLSDPTSAASSSARIDAPSPSSSLATFEDCFKTLKTMQQYLTKQSKTKAMQDSIYKDVFEGHLASFVDQLNKAVDKLKDVQKQRKKMEQMQQRAVRDQRAKKEKEAKQNLQIDTKRNAILNKTLLLQTAIDACKGKRTSLQVLNQKHEDCLRNTMQAVQGNNLRQALNTLSEGGLLEGTYGTAKALEYASYLFDKAEAFKCEEAIRFAAGYMNGTDETVASYRDLDDAYSKARRELVEATDKVSKQSKEYGDTLHHIQWMISEFRQRLKGVSMYDWHSNVPSSVAEMVAGKVDQASTFLKFTHTGRVEKADTKASLDLVNEAIDFFKPASEGKETLYDWYATMYNTAIEAARKKVEDVFKNVDVGNEAVVSKENHIQIWKKFAELLLKEGCPKHYYELLERDEFVDLLVDAEDTTEDIKKNLERYAKGRHPATPKTEDIQKMAIAILEEIKQSLESLSESVGTEELLNARKSVEETANKLGAHAKLLRNVQSKLKNQDTLNEEEVARSIMTALSSNSAPPQNTELSRGEKVTSVEWYGVSDLPMEEAAGEAKVFSKFLVSATTAIDNFVKVRVENQYFRKPPATAALQPTDDAAQLAKEAIEALVGAYSQLDEYVASIYSLEEGNTAFKHAQMKRTILDLASMPPFQYPAFQKTEAVKEGRSTSTQPNPTSVSYELDELAGMAGETRIALVNWKDEEDSQEKFLNAVFSVWSRVLLLVNLCGLQEMQLEAACKMRSLSLSKMSLLQMQMLTDQAHVCANYLTREARVQFAEEPEEEKRHSEEEKEKARKTKMRKKRVVNAFDAHQRWFEYRLTDTDIVVEFERFATMLSKAVANDASYESRFDELHPDGRQEAVTEDDMQTAQQSPQGGGDVQNLEKEQALAFLQSLNPMAADDTDGLYSLLEEAQQHDLHPEKRSAPTQRDKDAYKFVVGLEKARNRLAELESRSEQSAVRGWRLLVENVCKTMASRLMDETLAACNLCGMAMLLLLDQIAETNDKLSTQISKIDRNIMLPTLVSLDAKRRSFEVATSGEEAYGASRDASQAYEKTVDFLFERLASTKGLKGDAYAVEEDNTVMAHSLANEGIPKAYIDGDGSVNLEEIETAILSDKVGKDIMDDLKVNFPTIKLVGEAGEQQEAKNCLRRLLHSDFVQGVVQLRKELAAEGVRFASTENAWKTDLVDAIVSVELFSAERREYSEFLEEQNQKIQTELSSGMQADAGLVDDMEGMEDDEFNGDMEMMEDEKSQGNTKTVETDAASSSGAGAESEGKYASLMDHLLSISAFKAEESVVSRMLDFFNHPRTLLIGSNEPLNFLARTSRPMLSPMNPSTLHAESLDEAIQTVVFSAFAKAESKFIYNDSLEELGEAGGTETDTATGSHYSKVYNMETDSQIKTDMTEELHNIFQGQNLERFPFEILDTSKEEEGEQLQTAVFTIPCREVVASDEVSIVGTATAELGVFLNPIFHKGHQTDLDKHNVRIGISVKLKLSGLDDNHRSLTTSPLTKILSHLTWQRLDASDSRRNLQRIFPPREVISRMHEKCVFGKSISVIDLASRFFVAQGPVAGIGRLVTASFIKSINMDFPDDGIPYPTYLTQMVPMTYTFEDARTTYDKVNLLQAYYNSASAKTARENAERANLRATLAPRLHSMSLSGTESEPMALARAMPPSKIGQEILIEVTKLTVVREVQKPNTEKTPSNSIPQRRYAKVNLGNVLSDIWKLSTDIIEDTDIVDTSADFYMVLTQPRDGMLSNLIQSVEKGRRLRAREEVNRAAKKKKKTGDQESGDQGGGSSSMSRRSTQAGSAFQL